MECDVTELEPGDSRTINDVSSRVGDQTVVGEPEFAGGSFEDGVSIFPAGELDDGGDLRATKTDLDDEDGADYGNALEKVRDFPGGGAEGEPGNPERLAPHGNPEDFFEVE